MSLSNAKIHSIKPSDKPFKLTDSHSVSAHQSGRFSPLISQISLQPKRIPHCLRCLSAGITFRRPAATLQHYALRRSAGTD